MNSFFETNDFRSYQNSLRPDLIRFSNLNTNQTFPSGHIDPNLNFNDGFNQTFQSQGILNINKKIFN